MKLLIVVHHHFDLLNVPTWFPEKLQADFPQIEVAHRTNSDGVDEHLRDSEIIFAFSLRPEQFKLARKLRWIHAPTAAVHQLLAAFYRRQTDGILNRRVYWLPRKDRPLRATVFSRAIVFARMPWNRG